MTGRGRGAGVDDERAQFRLLFRTFLGGLFENDLVPETVDLRQSALWLAAVFMIPPAIFALFLSLSYGSWMTDEELALRAVPQKLYFIGYSMAAVGFVTVLVWDKLFPDRRDAIVAGSLPIRTRTLVLARLSALVAVVVGFAIVVNLPGTVIFSFVAGNYLPLEAFLRYPVAHFMATVSAGLLVFLALAALQACLALVLPVRFLRRLSMLAQLLFVVVLIEWLVFAPGLLVRLAAIDPGAASEALAAADGPYRFVGLTSSRAGIWLPPVWFLGLYEVIWGFDPEAFRGLAAAGLLALVVTLSIAALAYGAVFRRVVRHALETPPDVARPAGLVLLLCGFRKMPFACSYVPGKANVKYLWPVHALALTAYAWWTARLELWLLAEPLRWSIACALLIACLGACIARRRDRLASSTPLTYEEEIDEAVQVLGVMRT